MATADNCTTWFGINSAPERTAVGQFGKVACPLYFVLITWIADFQYLHLPELFPGLDVAAKTKHLQKIISQSDIVVLSSHDALGDFKNIAPPEYTSRGRVLQFVSQPNTLYENIHAIDMHSIEEKYGFKGKYFFLPNQFWIHKNHKTVFEAVKLLKDKGKEVLVLCTGWLCDPRDKRSEYVSSLFEFINENNLQTNVKILGLIDYTDVLSLLKNSVAVLNPSRFEGWSSSVEEAKSIGKQAILSNIGVHLEQNPPGGKYFDPDDKLALSSILEDAWDTWQDSVNYNLEFEALEQLHARTIEYGRKYIDIINELKCE
ncbi:MAG: glycosyltransferase [Desulfuromonadaceae bacterium]